MRCSRGSSAAAVEVGCKFWESIFDLKRLVDRLGCWKVFGQYVSLHVKAMMMINNSELMLLSSSMTLAEGRPRRPKLFAKEATQISMIPKRSLSRYSTAWTHKNRCWDLEALEKLRSKRNYLWRRSWVVAKDSATSMPGFGIGDSSTIIFLQGWVLT